MAVIPTYHHFMDNLRPSARQPRPVDVSLVKSVKQQLAGVSLLSNEDLAAKHGELREKVARGAALLDTSIIAPTFALTYEAVKRTLGLAYYDVQLLAGLALSTGAIAEMRTGEGKTIVTALPASLHGLTGKGVHVATVNGYLAERDYAIMRKPLRMLGLTVGLSKDGGDTGSKRRAYQCDITYSTGYELGFDFLRDQASARSERAPLLGETFRNKLRGLERRENPTVQRGHAYAIIDEVDSVLIDEANTPLILSHSSGTDEATVGVFAMAARVARSMEKERDYIVDRRKKTLNLTADGQRRIYESQADIPKSGLCRPWSMYVEQALRTIYMLQKDVDYVVNDGKVQIVDQYTGRIFADRHWRDGLHQAVEYHNRVEMTPEKQSIARVSRQRYFGLYDLLSGMSGTCTGHERELRDFYNLPVVVIPERLPSQRKHHKTRYFATAEDKWIAIAEDIRSRHAHGQPVLVGTRTIDESKILAQLLTAAKIPFQLLNGCQDDEEAGLVSNAGNVGVVTIATNMAGRGTDIKLSDEAKANGGLHVIATQRQESARVDRQLIGRAARQGQPGSCQFYISAEDELLTQHSPGVCDRIKALTKRSDVTSKELDNQTTKTQKQAERQTHEARCDLYRQDQWLNEVLVTVAEESTESLAAG